jgi:hypothetical protein
MIVLQPLTLFWSKANNLIIVENVEGKFLFTNSLFLSGLIVVYLDLLEHFDESELHLLRSEPATNPNEKS